jgi:AraC-like DNA-binding protein
MLINSMAALTACKEIGSNSRPLPAADLAGSRHIGARRDGLRSAPTRRDRARATRPLPGKDDSLTHIVSGLMQMAIGEAHKLDEAGSRRVGESLIQFVNGLIHAKPMAPECRCSPLETPRERIVAYIEANLARSSPSAEDIARHMGCSRRDLHRAFEGEGATLERFVWDRRLERSKEELLSPARTLASISEIAFACGFNSSAHFSRAFKCRYDVAPRSCGRGCGRWCIRGQEPALNELEPEVDLRGPNPEWLLCAASQPPRAPLPLPESRHRRRICPRSGPEAVSPSHAATS